MRVSVQPHISENSSLENNKRIKLKFYPTTHTPTHTQFFYTEEHNCSDTFLTSLEPPQVKSPVAFPGHVYIINLISL